MQKGQEGVSQMHSVKSKRTPSRMRIVVAWNRVPGKRTGEELRSREETEKLRARLVLRNDPRFSNPACTNWGSLDLGMADITESTRES
jgi:hypothetical protein